MHVLYGWVTSKCSPCFEQQWCTCLSSGDCLGLDKLKRPERKWDSEVCILQNRADYTTCAARESAKPGKNLTFQDWHTFLIFESSGFILQMRSPSFSSEPSQSITNTGNFKSGEQRRLKCVYRLTQFTQPMSFKISQSTGDFKFGVSTDSNSEEVKKKYSSNNNFNSRLSLGQQEERNSQQSTL